MKRNGTTIYQRQDFHSLTPPQLAAIDLLAAGKTDTEAAEAVGLSRGCVTRWRRYDPAFQAELNRRRAEAVTTVSDRLRSLVPQALDALADELGRADNPDRWKAACAVLKLAGTPAGAPAGPTEPEEVLRAEARRTWEKLPTVLDSLATNGRPDFEDYVEATRKRLAARLAEPDADEVPAPAEAAPAATTPGLN